MPKGQNKDGSKKQRPANSGRKVVPGKTISPKVSLEAAAVLATVKNQNKFITEAILEKAAREAEKKTIKPSDPGKPATGQVDLVDLLNEIKLDNVTTAIQKQPEPPKSKTQQMLEDIRERQYLRQEQEQQELDEWVDMQAMETWRDVEQLLKKWSKRKYKNALFIQLRARMEFADWKGSWRCWLELVDEKGKVINYTEKKASAQYVAEIMHSLEWKAVQKGDNTTHYLLPVNNLIAEKKPAKPTRLQLAKAEKKARVTDGTLASLLLSDTDELPEWMQVSYTTVADQEPVPAEETEPAYDPSALINLLNTDTTTNQLGLFGR